MEKEEKMIVDIVSRYYGVNSEEVMGKCRKGNLSDARSMSIYVLRKMLVLATSRLSVLFDVTRRDIFWHCSKMSRYIRMYEDVRAEYESIMMEFKKEWES